MTLKNAVRSESGRHKKTITMTNIEQQTHLALQRIPKEIAELISNIVSLHNAIDTQNKLIDLLINQSTNNQKQ